MWSHLNGKKNGKKCLLQHQILRIGFHLSRKHPSPKNQILTRYISIIHNSGKIKKINKGKDTGALTVVLVLLMQSWSHKTVLPIW